MRFAKYAKICARIGILASLNLVAWPEQLHADGPKTHVYVIYDTVLYRNAALSFSEVSAARGYRTLLLSNISDSLNPSWDGKVPESPKRNLMATLSKLVQGDLNSKKIGKGDQVLVQVLTHGAKRQAGEDSHSVEIGDEAVSLDHLKPILNDLSKAGVRVGVIDGTCYSGATLALKSKNVCVMSSDNASRGVHEDWGKNGTFIELFWSELKSRDPKENVSLENAFLTARSKRNLKPTSRPSYEWRFDRPELSSSKSQNLLDPLFEAVDQVRIPGPPGPGLDCSVLNLYQQIQFFESLSRDILRGTNQGLVEKLKKYSDGRMELERLDELLDPIRADSNRETLDPSLYLKRRELWRDVGTLESEIYQTEASLYQQYHEELRPKVGEEDPCRDFQL